MHKFSPDTLFIGKKIVFLPSCHSTNDIAASLVPDKKTYEGTVVITDNQLAGKGQRGNSWEAEPAKNLTLSVILKPTFLQIPDQFYLSIITSLAICDVLQKYLPRGLKIKWPNDIYYYDNKLGGILIENTIQYNKMAFSIVGIGLNINQIRFRNPNAISLAGASGKIHARENILEALLQRMEARYLQLKGGDRQKVREEYYQHLYWWNEEHVFQSRDFFTGRITGIDGQGRLGIEAGVNIHYFDIKEVRFVN